MEAFAYFPSLIYRDEKPEWVSALRDSLTEHFRAVEDNTSVRPGGAVLVQTAPLNEDRRFADLIQYLYDASVLILTDQGYAIDRYDFHLSGLWGQKITSGGATDVHVHRNSQLTGWIFLDTPTDGAYPVFKDPRYGKAMVELDHENSEEIKFATNTINFNNVRPGTVLIANSWLPHQVISGGSDLPTTTIHFIVSCREKGPTCCIQ